MKKAAGLIFLAVILFLFRYLVGLQVNFSHEDYVQVYLIGLESLINNSWPYWGPDIVWSARQLPGALQAYLISIPLKITHLPSAPIFVANLISFSGLLMMAWYAKNRFKNLPILLIMFIMTLLPYTVLNGAVLLNTCYLICTGSILFIATAELYLYRSDPLIKKKWVVPTSLGLAFITTFQLHLTWVMFLPFFVVFFMLELRESKKKALRFMLYLFVGMLIPMMLVLPTIIRYPVETFFNSEGSLVFQPDRLLKFFDVFIRYLSTATFNLNPKSDIAVLADKSFDATSVFLYILKILAGIQLIGIIVGGYLKRKEPEFRKLLVLFGLTLIMICGLYVLSNKHLSSRTFILLWPIPVWMSLYAYDALRKWKISLAILYGYCLYQIVIFVLITIHTYHGEFSVYAKEDSIKEAIRQNDAEVFDERRRTISPTD